ncbi:hypothetical protein V6N13_083613 [Hibiscus sabdariffa]
MLRRYRSDPSHVMPVEEVELNPDMSYDEKPVEILASDSKVLRGRIIELVKVKWRHRGVEEATWERKEDMIEQFPYLFPPVEGRELIYGLREGHSSSLTATLRGAFLKTCGNLERGIPQDLRRSWEGHSSSVVTILRGAFLKYRGKISSRCYEPSALGSVLPSLRSLFNNADRYLGEGKKVRRITHSLLFKHGFVDECMFRIVLDGFWMVLGVIAAQIRAYLVSGTGTSIVVSVPFPHWNLVYRYCYMVPVRFTFGTDTHMLVSVRCDIGIGTLFRVSVPFDTGIGTTL